MVLAATHDKLAEQHVREYYETVDRNDVDAVVRLFSDDIVYERPGYPAIHGQAQLREFYDKSRVIESGRHVVSAVVVDYPNVAVHGLFDGRVRGGSTVSVRFADFFQLDGDHRFARRDTFFFAPSV
jgi:ketosteroid isomerase-like protein